METNTLSFFNLYEDKAKTKVVQLRAFDYGIHVVKAEDNSETFYDWITIRKISRNWNKLKLSLLDEHFSQVKFYAESRVQTKRIFEHIQLVHKNHLVIQDVIQENQHLQQENEVQSKPIRGFIAHMRQRWAKLNESDQMVYKSEVEHIDKLVERVDDMYRHGMITDTDYDKAWCTFNRLKQYLIKMNAQENEQDRLDRTPTTDEQLDQTDETPDWQSEESNKLNSQVDQSEETVECKSGTETEGDIQSCDEDATNESSQETIGLVDSEEQYCEQTIGLHEDNQNAIHEESLQESEGLIYQETVAGDEVKNISGDEQYQSGQVESEEKNEDFDMEYMKYKELWGKQIHFSDETIRVSLNILCRNYC